MKMKVPFPPWRLGDDVAAERIIAYVVERSDQLRAALARRDHFEICAAIREYVYRTVNWSNCGLNGQRFFRRYSEASVSDVILLSLADEVGFLCGGTSEFLRKLYISFGYDAYIYNHGLRDVSTHVTTLVMIPCGADVIPVLQDATFNFTLETKDSRSVVAVFRAIAQGRFDEVRIVKGTIIPRDIYFLADSVHESFDYYQAHDVFLGPPQTVHSVLTRTKLLVVPADLDYDTSYRPRTEAAILEALSERLHRPRSAVDISQMMFFPINISRAASSDHQKVLDELLAIAADSLESSNRYGAAKQQSGRSKMNIRDMVKAGMGMYEKGDVPNAVSVFRHAVAVEPSYANAWNNLGVVLVQQNQVSEGLECLRNGFERNQANAELAANYVTVLRNLGRPDEAGTVVDQYVRAGGDPQCLGIAAEKPSGPTPESVSLDGMTIPVVAVQELHTALGFARPIDYPQSSLTKSLARWKMEIDDSPIFRYLYRHFRPDRHLEFGTWQGAGVVYCLEECDATVWTLNLPFGETRPDGETEYSGDGESYGLGTSLAGEWARRIGLPDQDQYRTDSFGFIGRFYLEKQLGHRVCQILCDSRQWDVSKYPAAFFDTALIDGGHFPDVVASDTEKALALLRPGGLVMWHDFCPPLAERSPVVAGVMQGVERVVDLLGRELQQLFWIKPSHILVGRKRNV